MLFGRRKHRRRSATDCWRFSHCLIHIAIVAAVGSQFGLGQVQASPYGEAVSSDTGRQYWEFPSDDQSGSYDETQQLILLPPIEVDLTHDDSQEYYEDPQEQPTADDALIAQLLPPVPLDVEIQETYPSRPLASIAQAPAMTSPYAAQNQMAPVPVLDELSKQRQMLAELLQDSSPSATGVLTEQRIDELAKVKIKNAYAMASRGSLYVAQKELVEVLRMISQAKDTHHGTNERTVALAAGLRALREAEDFAPEGTQLEADLNLDVLCASHRTPIARRVSSLELLPSQYMSMYLRYAQLKLAMSVAGEPAGSMALHALGKLHRQLGFVEPSRHRLADRRAVAYQQAALLAHNQNHLAAHELGVMLATSGHYHEANQLFQQVANREPNAVVLRNLARVQEKLGMQQEALANRDYARQLSQQGATGTNSVQWVSPEQFADATANTPRFKSGQAPIATAQLPPPQKVPVPGSRQPVRTIRR